MKMKKTDSRVQVVTESASIRLFFILKLTGDGLFSCQCHPHDQTIWMGEANVGEAAREARRRVGLAVQD